MMLEIAEVVAPAELSSYAEPEPADRIWGIGAVATLAF